MTAETDALRLVPEDVLDRLDDMMCDCKADGSLMLAESVANEHGEDLQMLLTAYRNLAASPAVQPAAGKEEIARLQQMIVDCEAEPDGPLMLSSSVAAEHAKDLRAILAAISTPAQASGEPVAWNFNLSEAPEGESVILATEGGHVGEAMTPVRADEDDGWFWVGAGFVHQNTPPLAWRPLPAHPDALSAPQAAPGEGEQS